MRKKLFYNLINLVRNLLPKDLVIKLLKEQVYWEDIDLINYNQNINDVNAVKNSRSQIVSIHVKTYCFRDRKK